MMVALVEFCYKSRAEAKKMKVRLQGASFQVFKWTSIVNIINKMVILVDIIVLFYVPFS